MHPMHYIIQFTILCGKASYLQTKSCDCKKSS